MIGVSLTFHVLSLNETTTPSLFKLQIKSTMAWHSMAMMDTVRRALQLQPVGIESSTRWCKLSWVLPKGKCKWYYHRLYTIIYVIYAPLYAVYDMLCCVLSIVSLECPLQLLLWVDWQKGRLESWMFLASNPPKANVSGLITICLLLFLLYYTMILKHNFFRQIRQQPCTYACN